MFSVLISLALKNMLYLALHIEGNGSFPRPLSPKMEREYFDKMEQGDMTARSKLIEHNLRLVAHIIKKYYANTTEQEDLISIGTIGLIKAVGTFNYKKGTKFATYASRCIENEILMHFRNLKKNPVDISINEEIDTDKDGNSLRIMDTIADETCIIDDIDLKLKAEQLYKFISTALTEREQNIVKLRYGLNGLKPLTQRDVAEKLNISRSYVSRIEKKALKILKDNFAKIGESYL